jgi:hypothetical protein
LGSTLAGVKAGVIAGIVLVGVDTLSNALMLYFLRSDVLTIITGQYGAACPQGTLDSCYLSLFQVYLPLVAFVGFFFAVAIGGIFGWAYDSMPGTWARNKSIFAALFTFAIFLSSPFYLGLDLAGIPFNALTEELTIAVLAVLSAVFGLLLGKMYTRYTRVVDIQSGDRSLQVLVGGRNMTGTKRTFATTSSHEVKATGEGQFREWSVSGGVTVEDPKSRETTMEVNGDGLIRAVGRASQ